MQPHTIWKLDNSRIVGGNFCGQKCNFLCFFAWYWWYVNCSEAWFRFAWFGTTVATQDHCLNQPWKLMPELARSSKIELILIFHLNSFESHHPFDKWDSDWLKCFVMSIDQKLPLSAIIAFDLQLVEPEVRNRKQTESGLPPTKGWDLKMKPFQIN